MKNPYQVIKHRLVTEKAKILESLKNRESSASLRKCDTPKYVFVVDRRANKREIAEAVEKIYATKNIKVVKVNTTLRKPRVRRMRGQMGKTAYQKKAVITLKAGQELDDQI